MLRLLLPWLFCLLLLWPAWAGAAASVVNGDFSIANPADPNFGWTREGAAVVDGGAAQLSEGGAQFASLSQRFTIAAGTPSLSIVLLSLQFASNGTGEPPDALQVHLLDGQGNSLAGVARDAQGPLTGTRALLTLQQTGELCYSEKVSIAGAGVPASGGIWTSPSLPAVVTIDLSHITANTNATVVIELLSFGADGSSVRIDNVQTVAFPVAVNDSATTQEDTPVDIGVLTNDTDPGGTLITATVTVAAAPAHGSATVKSDGTIRYAPAANYSGADSFTYTVRDNDGNLSNAATVAVNVSPVNDPPTANAGRDQSVTAGNTVTLDGSGSDPEGSALTYLWEQIGTPTVTLSGTTVARPTFTAPPVEPAGAQLTFRLTVTDASQLSSSDTVVISVAQAGFTPPHAADDTAATAEDTPVVINLLQNDTAAAGTTLNPATVQIIVPPGHGAVTLNAQTGAATYTPAANYSGPPGDAFTYKVTDFKGLVSNEALVQLTITAVNDPPVANAGPDQSVTGGAAVTLSGAASSDTEGAIASYLWTQTGGTTVALSNPNTVQTTFAAPGGTQGATLTFRLTVTDAGGLQQTDTVAVQVVTQGLFPPVANSDSATTAEDTPVTIDVLANDSSTPTGNLNPATVTVVAGPGHGAVTLNAQTGVATYAPVGNYFGSDSFTYQVKDNAGTLSNAVMVTVTITAVNDPPVVVAGPEQSVREGFIVTLDGSGSRDVEDATPTFAWTQIGGTPTVTFSDAGAAKPTFTAPNVGPDGALLTFQLKVTDSGGLWATDTVNIRIANAVIPCDVNDDKAVNLADAVLLLRMIAGIPMATSLLLAADVNGDQLLGMPEAFCALQTAAGLRFDPNRDADGDGFTPRQGDCNDNSAAIHPGAVEICNGIDDNCNGLIDEGLPQITYYRDADGDGYGDPNVWLHSCSRPAGYVTNSTDCNDSDPRLNPGQIWYRDSDNDGYSDGTTGASCTRPPGYKAAVELLATSGDCNDNDANVHAPRTWFRDADSDGFGDPNATINACSQPGGYVVNNTDCNDGNALVHPGAAEICNGIDDNCNGQIDDGAATTWYRDADGDGYSDGTTVTACARPAGYKLASELTATSIDCNDANAAIYATMTGYADLDADTYTLGGAQTFCTNGSLPQGYVAVRKGEDCNDNNNTVHATMTGYADQDSDTYTLGGAQTFCTNGSLPQGYVAVQKGEDCNDANPAIHPGAAEVCNGLDDNCNGQIDEGVMTTYYRDADSDGYGDPNVTATTLACSVPSGYVANNMDCNDGNALVHPGATETCNGVDDNCNGEIDEGVKNIYYRDIDGDGYGNPTVTTDACVLPEGYVTNSTDCNDSSAAIHPGATEICGDGIDQDCNGSDLVCSTLPTATLVSTPPPPPPGSFDGFIFGNGQVTQINPDFVIRNNLIFLRPTPPVGILDLGLTTLDVVTNVPATGYTFFDPTPGANNIPTTIQSGHVYAFKLPDGSYAAIEFTEIAVSAGGSSTRCTFRYKYPLTAQVPVVSGIQLASYGWPPAGGFDGFDFSTGLMVSNPDPPTLNPLTDFYIEWNGIWLGSNVGIVSLGNTVALADVAAVPFMGYVTDNAYSIPPFSLGGNDATGYVYALKLADGTYAAIQFTQYAYDPDGVGGSETLRTTFSYKYPLTAAPPPSNVVTGTNQVLVDRATYDNDAFIFSTQQVVADDGTIPWDGPADMAVKGASLFFAAGGIQPLGAGTTLATTTSVPASGYMPAIHAGIYGLGISTGQVYALQLGDGKYAAIEFTEITTGPMPNHCTFSYKYQTNGTPSLQ